MKDLAELKRLLAAWTANPKNGYSYGNLADAAVNALPDIIAEIENLRQFREQVDSMSLRLDEKTDVLMERVPLMAQRIERLEAALREIAVGCDTRTPRDTARAALGMEQEID